MSKSKVQLLEKEKKAIVTFDKEDLIKYGLMDYLLNKDRAYSWCHPFERKATQLFRQEHIDYEVKKPEVTKIYETAKGPEVQVSLFVNRFSRTETLNERIKTDPKLERKEQVKPNMKEAALRIKEALTPSEIYSLNTYIKDGKSIEEAKAKIKPVLIARYTSSMPKTEGVDPSQALKFIEKAVDEDLATFTVPATKPFIERQRASSKKYCAHCGAYLKTAIISITPYEGNPESQLSGQTEGYAGGGGVPEATGFKEQTTYPTIQDNKDSLTMPNDEDLTDEDIVSILDLDKKGVPSEEIAEKLNIDEDIIKEVLEEENEEIKPINK